MSSIEAKKYHITISTAQDYISGRPLVSCLTGDQMRKCVDLLQGQGSILSTTITPDDSLDDYLLDGSDKLLLERITPYLNLNKTDDK